MLEERIRAAEERKWSRFGVVDEKMQMQAGGRALVVFQSFGEAYRENALERALSTSHFSDVLPGL